MQHILARKAPGTFKTLALNVRADAQSLHYQPQGMPLNFTQMLERRQPLAAPTAQPYELELANLGVSVRLTLNWQGRDYWVVVRQQRHDRQDTVLKLISGYVPAHELSLPLISALQEIAEECLIEDSGKWLSGRYANTWLPTPYPLPYHDDLHFDLQPLEQAAKPVFCGNLALHEQPEVYIHLPTSSLQLVYALRLELPAQCRAPSLFHVDECLEDGELIARLDRHQPNLYLMALDTQQRPTGELYQLQQGRLVEQQETNIYLSEAFAEQHNWLLSAERVAWQHWQQRLAQALRA